MNETSTLVMICVDHIFPHPDNPRKDIGNIKELAASISAKGIMQNLTVVPRGEGRPQQYTVIIGHRRLAAARFAGLTHVPCVITNMSEREQLATMLLENIQRSDLTVYEQAQGFQMMFDLGESVDGIAEKTGFSKSTVRRRLKMAELDQNTLKEVSGRQLSLADFDRLSEIEDINVRNKVLESIGTPNFNQSLASKLKEQNIKKRLPDVKAIIKGLGAKKIQYSETYGGKYERVTDTIKFWEWEPDTPLIEDKALKKVSGKLYYYLNESWGDVSFYKDRPKAAPVKRPQEEIDREKYIAESRERLTQLTADMYRLRAEFAESLRITEKNKELMLRGAVLACARFVTTYVSTNSVGLYKQLGVSTDPGITFDERVNKVIDLVKGGDKEVYVKVILSAFGDREDMGYFTGYKYEYPRYSRNPQLDVLYDWLISLGYEMSDDERQLRDGTHLLFVDKDKPGDEDVAGDINLEEQEFEDDDEE